MDYFLLLISSTFCFCINGWNWITGINRDFITKLATIFGLIMIIYMLSEIVE